MTRLVIVGGGTAGLAAAATASELGVEAVILEKTDRLGGMLEWSSGHFSGAGTRRQVSRGIEDNPDLHFADVMRMGNGRNDPDLARLAVDQAPLMVDWLEDIGFPFSADTPALVRGHEVYSRPRTYWGGDDPGAGGKPIADTLLRTVDPDLVESKLEARVSRLLIGNGVDGRKLDGVEYVQNGLTHRIEGCPVLLATGGYGADREMVTAMQPLYPEALTGCMDHATGDAHRQLAEFNVSMTHGDTYVPTMGMIEDPDNPGHGLRLNRARLIVDSSQRLPWEVWVNRSGQRFVAEDTESPFERERALLGQPGLEMFAIWDQTVVSQSSPPIGPSWEWDDLIETGQREGWLETATSIEELASSLGIDGTGLTQALSEYCADGDDPFGRRHRPTAIQKAPFYAVRVVGGMLLSRGGPAVDERLRPVSADEGPITDLYCVGELLGMGKFSGDSFAGGMSVGPALSLARWIVTSLATRT